jgi:hypothetical protein
MRTANYHTRPMATLPNSSMQYRGSSCDFMARGRFTLHSKTGAANHVKLAKCHIQSHKGRIFLDGKASLKPLI